MERLIGIHTVPYWVKGRGQERKINGQFGGGFTQKGRRTEDPTV